MNPQWPVEVDSLINRADADAVSFKSKQLSPTLGSKIFNLCFPDGLIPLGQSLLAEFVGITILIAIGCGAVLTQQGNHVAIPLAWFTVLFGLITTFDSVSGAHFNPAVTLAVVAIGKMSWIKASFYIITQLCGACVGALLIRLFVPGSLSSPLEAYHLGSTALAPGVEPVDGMFIEVFLTFLLVTVAFMTAMNPAKPHENKAFFPLSVASAVAACIFLGGPLTGASLNPARSFGPALVSNFWKHHWVFWIGPISGGLLAALFFKVITHGNTPITSYETIK